MSNIRFFRSHCGPTCAVLALVFVTCSGFAAATGAGEESAPKSAQRGLPWTVGPDAGCDFPDLQSAIDFAIDGEAIHLMDGGGYTGDTYQVHNKGLLIRGGYPDCDPASEPSGRTVLDADGQGRVFDIWRPDTSGLTMVVTLENLDIRNGAGASLGGGGVLVDGPFGGLAVDLINTAVQNNTTTGNGGGVAVRMNAEEVASGMTMLDIDNDSSITGNTADGHGGGLSCDNNGHFNNGVIARIGAIEIANNTATRGGGVYDNGCRAIFHYSGGPIFLIVPTGAVFNNTATEHGGGIYAEGATTYYFRGMDFSGFGDPDHAAHLIGNEAPQGGGGAYVAPGAKLELTDAVVASNSSTSLGGGVYVNTGGELIVQRWEDTPCEPAESGGGLLSVPRCNRFRNNSASGGGGVYVAEGGSADVSRAIFHDNSVGLHGAAAYVSGTATLESVLIHDNSGNNLLYARDNGQLELHWSTVAANPDASGLLRVVPLGVGDEARLDVFSSILWSPGRQVLTADGNGTYTATGDCVIGHQDAGSTAFTSLNFYSNIDPGLIEHDERLYFPGPTSPAIDYCDDFNAPETTDLSGVARGIGHTGDPPVDPPDGGIGDYDIGAYETDWGNKSVALEFGVEPLEASVGVPMAPMVEVQVIDGSGGVATGDNSTVVELVLSGGNPNAVTNGAGPVTVTDGTAIFPILAVDLPGSDYQFTAVATDLEDATSVAFDVLAPEPVPDPGLMDFGDVDIGSPTPPQTAFVDNLGDGELDLGTLSLEGQHPGDFSFTSGGDACSGELIGPGESCAVELFFSPVVPGVRQARVRIPSNHPDGPDYLFLRGTNDVVFGDGFESF